MNKLDMAHDWAMKSFLNHGFKDESERAAHAWKYADAMQAEADKRVNKERPEVLESVDPKEYMDAVLKNITELCDHEWTHIKHFGAAGDFYVCPCGAKSERPHGF